MVARLQAQARELTAKAEEASRAGDQERYIKLHKEWVRVMRRAMMLA